MFAGAAGMVWGGVVMGCWLPLIVATACRAELTSWARIGHGSRSSALKPPLTCVNIVRDTGIEPDGLHQLRSRGKTGHLLGDQSGTTRYARS